jgi:iron complex outermembrane receptor protein
MTSTTAGNSFRIAVAASLAWSYHGAIAAEPTAATEAALQEIVVTATRREERLEDVPISVTAFSQEKMDAQGLKNIEDLTRLTPGVTFSRNGSGTNYNDESSDINIRGIDSSAGASTTGIYIDDTPVQARHIGFGSVNAFPALFDLDRVEVLRGPQGTLFGAGAEGGAVRFITPEPGLTEYSGYDRAELAFTQYGAPSYEAGAAFGGPIIDNVLGFRVSTSYRLDGGWVDRASYDASQTNPLTPPVYTGTTERNANWEQTVTGRVALKWQPTDNLSVTPSIYYQHVLLNDTGAYWASLSNASEGIFRNGNALKNPSDDPYFLAAVKVEWSFSWAQLISNTSYFSRNLSSRSDYSQFDRAIFLYNSYPPPGSSGYSTFGDKQTNLYQEIRLASIDSDARFVWTAGLYAAKTRENVPQSIYDPNLSAESVATYGPEYAICTTTVPCPKGLIYYGPTDQEDERQVALFGESTLKIVETLKATLGFRISRIEVTGATAAGGAFDGVPLVPLETTYGSSTQTPVTPKAGLEWQPAHDQLFYTSVSKGFRSGGVNAQVPDSCAADLQTIGLPVGSDGQRHVPSFYGSDSLWSYEIGAKNTLLDHRLQINSSLFWINWKGIQQNVYLPICGEEYAANLGKVRSVGGDVDIIFRPIKALTTELTVAYTDPKYTQASCAGSLTFNGTMCSGATGTATPVASAGDVLPSAPWTFLASAEYAAPFAMLGGRTFYARLDYQESTAQPGVQPSMDYHNSIFDSTLPGVQGARNLSLRAGMRFSGFDISVFGNNLTNNMPILYEARDVASECVTGAPCGAAPNSPPEYDNLYFARSVRPRTIGLTATYRY